jgi:hypothetical protein
MLHTDCRLSKDIGSHKVRDSCFVSTHVDVLTDFSVRLAHTRRYLRMFLSQSAIWCRHVSCSALCLTF